MARPKKTTSILPEITKLLTSTNIVDAVEEEEEPKELDEKIVLVEEELDLSAEEERMVKKFAERYVWSDEYDKYIQIAPLVPGGLIRPPTYSKNKEKKLGSKK